MWTVFLESVAVFPMLLHFLTLPASTSSTLHRWAWLLTSGASSSEAISTTRPTMTLMNTACDTCGICTSYDTCTSCATCTSWDKCTSCGTFTACCACDICTSCTAWGDHHVCDIVNRVKPRRSKHKTITVKALPIPNL